MTSQCGGGGVGCRPKIKRVALVASAVEREHSEGREGSFHYDRRTSKWSILPDHFVSNLTLTLKYLVKIKPGSCKTRQKQRVTSTISSNAT